jgi:GH25 family lysozyme M1 (1,4-beta-N-acetylmuramidase)
MRLGFRVAAPLGLGLLLITLIPVGAGIASATSSQWAANCTVNLRAKPTTLSTRKTSIATGTVVTISAKVAGGAYGTSCRTQIYGSSWFAITAIGGRSVRSLYGVTTLYAASGLFRSGAGIASATSSQWAANCTVNLRAKPTALSIRKTSIATGTVVTISAKVAGGAYGTSCRTQIYGSSWFAITAIGGRSVRSLYGVTTLYASSGLFRSVARAPSGPLEGIDVSEWQGHIDFAKVRASGKRFVIARATVGRYYTDPAYSRNRSAALAAGLAFTAYHYAQPDSTTGDATREADHFIAAAGLKRGMLAPVLDLETGSRLGVSRLQIWVRTWLARVYARVGVRPMIYTTASFWQTAMGNSRWFADNGYHVVWVANWGVTSLTVPASNWSGRSWGFWQYSDCGHVSGISGCVDLDRFNGTDLSRIRF